MKAQRSHRVTGKCRPMRLFRYVAPRSHTFRSFNAPSMNGGGKAPFIGARRRKPHGIAVRTANPVATTSSSVASNFSTRFSYRSQLHNRHARLRISQFRRKRVGAIQPRYSIVEAFHQPMKPTVNPNAQAAVQQNAQSAASSRQKERHARTRRRCVPPRRSFGARNVHFVSRFAAAHDLHGHHQPAGTQ